MMNGMIRIIETVIATIIILTGITFFFGQEIRETGWGDTYFKIRSIDALNVLYKHGNLERFMLEKDTTFPDLVEKILTSRVAFGLEVIGLPPPVIKIGCNCTDEKTQKLKRAIIELKSSGDFTFKGREIDIRIKRDSLINGTQKDYHLVITYDPNVDIDNVKELLSKGKGIILISDLNLEDCNDIKDIFNLSCNSEAAGDRTTFYKKGQPEYIGFKISNYFTDAYIRLNTTEEGGTTFHVNGTDQLDTERFSNKTTDQWGTKCYEVVEYPAGSDNWTCKGNNFTVHGYPVHVYDIDADPVNDDIEYTDIGIIDENYRFNLTTDNIDISNGTVVSNGDHSGIVTNQYNEGRTVWMNEYHENATGTNQLLKSIILWASGETYEAIDTFEEEPKFYFRTPFLMAGNKGKKWHYQPYQINLVIWYIFM